MYWHVSVSVDGLYTWWWQFNPDTRAPRFFVCGSENVALTYSCRLLNVFQFSAFHCELLQGQKGLVIQFRQHTWCSTLWLFSCCVITRLFIGTHFWRSSALLDPELIQPLVLRSCTLSNPWPLMLLLRKWSKGVSIFRNLEWVPTQNGQCQESNYHQYEAENETENKLKGPHAVYYWFAYIFLIYLFYYYCCCCFQHGIFYVYFEKIFGLQVYILPVWQVMKASEATKFTLFQLILCFNKKKGGSIA